MGLKAGTELEDWLGPFSDGVNNGVAPLLLSRTQLSNAMNVTVRGTYAQPRPPFRKRTLSTDSQTILNNALVYGPYQGGSVYNPDSGDESIVCAIGGHLYKIVPDDSTGAVVTELTTPGPKSAALQQSWMWQSEKWLIWQDGFSNPYFYDGTTVTQSNYGGSFNFATDITAGSFIIPAVGQAFSAPVGVTSSANMLIGDILTIAKYGTFSVQNVPGGGVTVELVNITGIPGKKLALASAVTWSHVGVTYSPTDKIQLPPGRMGTYGMGRNWVCLADGKQFVASDLVGGSSGTAANNYRDSVLYITENQYLTGGGNFAVPGSIGDITFMKFMATLDTSLGQGPLMVGTHSQVFSCQSPVDRLLWQDVQNPILTNALITNGGLSQNSTKNVNGDIVMRSVDGIRSLILARRDFTTWGNTPISREVDPLLSHDSPDLLPWTSSIVFDNRMLMTSVPSLVDQGVFFRAIVPLNFDPVSSLRGKAQSVYDSLAWTGLNILQLFVGEFQGTERAFALTLNRTTTTPFIELYEILPSATSQIYDLSDTDHRIVWTFESPVLFNQNVNPAKDLLRLADGEIMVDQMLGTVTFQVWYKPDQYPCWTKWFEWDECAAVTSSQSQFQFRPRMGLGEPSADDCDPSTNRPMREGYSFQIKLVVSGHCRFLGARIKATVCNQSKFAPQQCKPICDE